MRTQISSSSRHIFITGGSGYIGKHLIRALLARGHRVRALVRAGSEKKLPPGCEVVIGNALDAATFRDQVAPCDTFVQMVGVPHPSPRKARQFQEIDLVAAYAGMAAAHYGRVEHFVYLSVAQPAPVMRAYVGSRVQAETRASSYVAAGAYRATFIRPWYVLGPGHRWPYLLMPLYALARMLPCTRENATRLGLVTLPEMVSAMTHVIENQGVPLRIIDVPGIRKWSSPLFR
ncbi:MAG: NAD(P)H-binding protein [Betaproteobacteria bacterium]|nr:NAD(P)H-binding protein [Betaproteobacteria bacterium]